MKLNRKKQGKPGNPVRYSYSKLFLKINSLNFFFKFLTRQARRSLPFRNTHRDQSWGDTIRQQVGHKKALIPQTFLHPEH